ncbi:alpha/beta fold hydrolase [Aspergillus saccharolyticus JOP 1030-1]|uniref:Alpha/beta-hydrolase n=1 Tax=Aspergillus saccharolyticus JOP 1030-1 TaxID=1450539 RepID=A0A318Z085_9EURO|nr:alpha/beta-hydrolase [Aspergillus saccharolyticus JOP 1030-1]PYH40406.1 alpha/beta-hydrolase [Aspergillus saccharolyticus JOP 1030-1]
MAEVQFLALTTKPSAQLAYTFQAPEATTTPVLVVFLNGLGLPQAFWQPVIRQLQTLRQGHPLPAFLTYDRYGQGQTTDRDPQDADAADPTHGHDCLAAVQDLRQLLVQITRDQLGVSDLATVRLVLVGNSIGCALARLYAQEYPGTVAALLLLDSVLANSDFVSVFPDPDAPGFDPASIAPIPVEAIRAVRAGARRVFHPEVGSKEGLSRRNLRQLLPHSDGPPLQGPDGHGPYVTVVGHDFDAFAAESAKMGPPAPVTNRFVNPYWQRYNEGLAQITAPEYSMGPVIAPNAGHFVQKDNPEFVAQELNALLEKVL